MTFVEDFGISIRVPLGEFHLILHTFERLHVYISQGPSPHAKACAGIEAKPALHSLNPACTYLN
jgi:hypothetical protein